MPARFLALLITALLPPLLSAADEPRYLTYDTLPMGTADHPLLLRTYVPDPGLDPAVFQHHSRTDVSPKYDPTSGRDVPGGYTPIKGIPAAVAVNHGPALSYVFDTTEGRLMYAWQGGFLDMYPYWGNQELGGRVSYDYVPRLVGTVFYQASGDHPVTVNGRSVSELGPPRYVGYDLVQRQPEFLVRFGPYTIRMRVEPLADELGSRLELASEPAAALDYRVLDPKVRLAKERTSDGRLVVTLLGSSLGNFAGYPRRVTFAEASVSAGEQIARTYACVTCHSTDGSPGYGPSWLGLYGGQRPLADGSSVEVDDDYLLESILHPNVKIARGFAPNFMPAYTMLKPVETESLVLYMKSLRRPE